MIDKGLTGVELVVLGGVVECSLALFVDDVDELAQVLLEELVLLELLLKLDPE